ncbi:MAG: hypothetical protein ACE5J6_00640 [Candidatus Bathyarchaeia archaeon]
MFYGRIILNSVLLNSFFAGNWLLEEVGFFKLLKALFFFFIIFCDVVDDEKNDKSDENGAGNDINSLYMA